MRTAVGTLNTKIQMGMIGSLTDREYQKFEETVDNLPAVRTFSINQLVPNEFDSIKLAYSGGDLTTVTYYVGGTSGTAVATLTLSYSGGDLVAIEKS